MRARFRHLRRDERGMSFAFVGIGFFAFLSATTLAVDVGMFMAARNQAQNAADAGALAGATALIKDSFTDRSASGPVVQSAISAALQNPVIGEPASVGPDDVTFPTDPNGIANRVRVWVYRNTQRSNPVATLMGPLFGLDTVDIGAMATAEASPANTIECVKPFMIPDRWKEKRDPPWAIDSTFDMFDNQGNPLTPQDYYNGDLMSPNYTGYDPDRDRGTQLILRAGTGNNIYPTMYYSWKMPPDIGGDFYRENIGKCNQEHLEPGDLMIQEPGNKVGETNQGIDELIAQDPSAMWDTTCKCVKYSDFGVSPRVVPIPLYDPIYYETGKQNGRNADFKLANWLGFFIEGRNGNEVTGRIIPIMGIIDKNLGPPEAGVFPKAVRLVE